MKTPDSMPDEDICAQLNQQLYAASSRRGSQAKRASMNSMLNKLYELLDLFGLLPHWWYVGRAISTKARFELGYKKQPVGVVMDVFAANNISFTSYGVIPLKRAVIFAAHCKVELSDALNIMELGLIHGLKTSAMGGGLNSETNGNYQPGLPVQAMFYALRLSASEYMVLHAGVSLSDALVAVGTLTPEEVFDSFYVELSRNQNDGDVPLTAQAAYDLVKVMGGEAKRTVQEPSWRAALAAGMLGVVTPTAAEAFENAEEITRQKKLAGGEAWRAETLLKAKNSGRMIVSGTVRYSLNGTVVDTNFLAPICIHSGRLCINIYLNVNGSVQRQCMVCLFPTHKKVKYRVVKLKGEIKLMNTIGKLAWKKLEKKEKK